MIFRVGFALSRSSLLRTHLMYSFSTFSSISWRPDWIGGLAVLERVGFQLLEADLAALDLRAEAACPSPRSAP